MKSEKCLWNSRAMYFTNENYEISKRKQALIGIPLVKNSHLQIAIFLEDYRYNLRRKLMFACWDFLAVLFDATYLDKISYV